ncbi:MAG TPA: DNA alkylation repair protein [Caproiciproducens sp.]|nr:DNA alkylation repair protein [Caproiciproducens sp.]
MEKDFEYRDYPALAEHVRSLADEPYRRMQNKIVPGIENILGVRVPKLRALAKQIAKGDWRAYLSDAQDDTMEEVMLQGLVIGYAKAEPDEKLCLLADFVPKIDNWAVCDVCCSSLKFTEKNREKVFGFLQRYLQSSREFELRFAAVMLMDFYITEDYIDALLKIYDGIRHEGYYVKMAVAWALSVCFVKFPEKTMRYLNSNSLDDWTYNKALQKITQSYRVDDGTKAVIRSMKRKGKQNGI